jgi:serine acetyltransferase
MKNVVLIGAGATVVNDVPANTTVVGMPAKAIQMCPAGWQNELE